MKRASTILLDLDQGRQSTVPRNVIWFRRRSLFCGALESTSMRSGRVSRDRGVTVLNRFLNYASIIAVVGVLLAVLSPPLAAFGVPTSGMEFSCHPISIDMTAPSIANGHATECEDSGGISYCSTDCAMPGCVAAPVPALPAFVLHDGAVLKDPFHRGAQAPAGIGAPPGLRPPIRATVV